MQAISDIALCGKSNTGYADSAGPEFVVMSTQVCRVIVPDSGVERTTNAATRISNETAMDYLM
ncbi:hypothetical protein D3C71_1842850 [compost metagenome]